MRYTFKALFIGSIVFFCTIFLNVKLSAQDHIPSQFVGTWALDSVQVKEVMPDDIIQKTVLPGQNSNFNSNWMQELTLVAEKQLLYMNNNLNSSNTPIINEQIPYTIEEIKENVATIVINRTADYRILKIQQYSQNALLITQSFTTTNSNMQRVEVSWKMFYHKSN